MNSPHSTHANVVCQLKEVFPELDEEFLGQFCEGYEEHELLVEEIVEVILSLDIVPHTAIIPQPSSSLLVEGPGIIENLEGSGKRGEVASATIEIKTATAEMSDLLTIRSPEEISVIEPCSADPNDVEVEPCDVIVVESNCDGKYDDVFDNDVKVEPCDVIVAESNCDGKCDDVFDIRFLFNCNSSSDVSSNCVTNGNNNDDEYDSYSSSGEELFLKNSSPNFQGCIPKKLHKVSTKRKTLLGMKRTFKANYNCDKIVKKRQNGGKMKVISQKRLSLEGNSSFPTRFLSPPFKNSESKFALLKKILPDADDQYLTDQSKILCDDSSLLIFIAESLDRKDYPKMNRTEEHPSMMDNFECNIEEFLKEIPDPMAEFMSDTYMRSGYEMNAEIYLQSRYRNVHPTELKERLSMYLYNLTRVCIELEDAGEEPSPYCLNSTPLHHPASIFFHQEVWFIEHRQEIEDYTASVVEAIRTEELINRPPTPVPQVVREVFECKICAEEIEDYNQLGSCDAHFGHLFCFECIRRQVEIKFAEGETLFFCLFNQCEGTFPLQTIRDVLSAQLFKRLEDKIHAVQVSAANIPGIENCPFCDYAYCPGEEKLFQCRNLDCRQISCRICKKLDHSPHQCKMFQEEDEETARLMIEERMAQAMIRNCHSCGKPIVKSDGCNKMTCTCGAQMCYLCRSPVTDYKHFNGQGGDNYDRCELFSTEDKVHVAPVVESGQQALDEIQRNNPGLKVDASLIPK